MNLQLFDTQLAIKSAEYASNPLWREETQATIKLHILRGHDFTSEDVLKTLQEKGVTTKDNRALGGLFQSFSRSGDIRKVYYRSATRRERHFGTVAVWRPVKRFARV